MEFPNNVYGWNRYQGTPQPTQNDTGLPTLFKHANLPLQVPDESSDMVLDYPYSPVLMEMGTAPAGIRPTPRLPAAPAVGTPLNQPASPSLWRTVARAVFGGVMSVNAANNTATLAAGGALKS